MEIEVKEEESLCSSSESDFNDEDDGEIGDLGEHMEIKKKPLRMVPFYHIESLPKQPRQEEGEDRGIIKLAVHIINKKCSKKKIVLILI